jgi:energy-coupling factor transport system ATP-binding protein
MMAITLTDLSHSYHPGSPSARVALRHITLEIPPGICLGIAGGPGAGKTTLIQHLNGLLQPTSGRIAMDGVEVTARNRGELRRRVGIVFQYPEQQLFAETVYQEIAFALTGEGMSSAAIDQRVRETLNGVGLSEELLGQSPFSLSGGEKRRVAIAGILVRRPEILVLDEPGVGLDPQGRQEILDSVAQLQRESGLTLVLVSHQLEEIVRLAERVIILQDGAIVLEGESREILRDLTGLAKAGLALPPITAFMLELKKSIPELNDCILSVAEARAELKRVWALPLPRGGRQ